MLELGRIEPPRYTGLRLNHRKRNRTMYVLWRRQLSFHPISGEFTGVTWQRYLVHYGNEFSYPSIEQIPVDKRLAAIDFQLLFSQFPQPCMASCDPLRGHPSLHWWAFS